MLRYWRCWVHSAHTNVTCVPLVYGINCAMLVTGGSFQYGMTAESPIYLPAPRSSTRIWRRHRPRFVCATWKLYWFFACQSEETQSIARTPFLKCSWENHPESKREGSDVFGDLTAEIFLVYFSAPFVSFHNPHHLYIICDMSVISQGYCNSLSFTDLSSFLDNFPPQTTHPQSSIRVFHTPLETQTSRTHRPIAVLLLHFKDSKPSYKASRNQLLHRNQVSHFINTI